MEKLLEKNPKFYPKNFSLSKEISRTFGPERKSSRKSHKIYYKNKFQNIKFVQKFD